ncbi:MAG: nucleotidyltransferase family protein [Anaerolineales bacterium]|nr:nucleotidyltransferase family protein [Anaerolineales bacterium]
MTLEETLAYEFALRWRDETYSPDLQHVDWTRFARLLTHNRMAVLAEPILRRVDASIPNEAQNILDEQIQKYQRSATKLGQSLVSYLNAADSLDIETIVLKGLWLCEKIYGNSAMRPGGDIDILVRKHKVDACLALLDEQGIGQYWHNLMHDDYFTRHHLHQQRCTRDLNIWFEIHWALDHPYTLLTVDYESIFTRAKPSALLDAPIQEMSLPDLLLSLAIHLVKHAVYLPSLVHSDELPRIILADGMLMYYLDIAEVVKQHSDIDWGVAIQLAREWGAVDILGSVLLTCKKYFDAPIPDEALDALRVTGPWRVTKSVMARVAEHELAAYEGKTVSKFWKLMLASNGAFILRPVRLLETASYFFPPADFLKRRYGRSNILLRIFHLAKAFLQTLRFGWDSIYFGVERYLRLKRLGESASLFNRLETDL